LANAACGCVARVSKWRLALGNALLIELQKIFFSNKISARTSNSAALCPAIAEGLSESCAR
jgi:hypothetical protein